MKPSVDEKMNSDRAWTKETKEIDCGRGKVIAIQSEQSEVSEALC